MESHQTSDEVDGLIHDLRTPLMVIKSVITMFSRYWERLDPERRRNLLEIAQEEISRLDQRIEGLALKTPIRLDEEPDRAEQ